MIDSNPELGVEGTCEKVASKVQEKTVKSRRFLANSEKWGYIPDEDMTISKVKRAANKLSPCFGSHRFDDYDARRF